MSKQIGVRRQHTTLEPGWPDPGHQCVTLTAAMRLVRSYGNRAPSVEQLIADFGISRATAYRWRAAFIEAQQQDRAA